MDKNLAPLILSWQAIKKREQDANQARLAIEKQILSLLPKVEEGAETIVAGNHKMKIQFGITRVVDEEKYESLINGIVDRGLDPFYRKSEIALDMKKYRAIEELHPELMKVIGQAITIKPKKASFTIEEVKDEN